MRETDLIFFPIISVAFVENIIFELFRQFLLFCSLKMYFRIIGQWQQTLFDFFRRLNESFAHYLRSRILQSCFFETMKFGFDFYFERSCRF